MFSGCGVFGVEGLGVRTVFRVRVQGLGALGLWGLPRENLLRWLFTYMYTECLQWQPSGTFRGDRGRERERERERVRETCVYIYIYRKREIRVYIYIYIYVRIYICRPHTWVEM